MPEFFCTLDSSRIATLIRGATRCVAYAAPGVHQELAHALVAAAGRLGPEMITLCLDFDERVLRMGFGDIEAVKQLDAAKIHVRHAPGLRTALVLVDDEGYVFTPTALFLEAEPRAEQAANAVRLSPEQLGEALARLSPAAKAIATAQASSKDARERIAALPVEIGSEPVNGAQLAEVDHKLSEVPPARFDVARQVRVFSAYLQYVELSLIGAAIQRHRLAIPPHIQALGGSRELEGRLRTTFDLIEKSGPLSSRALERELNDIRKTLTRALGKAHGRVVLKSAKPRLEERLAGFREALEAHQKKVEAELKVKLEASRKQIVDYYLPRVCQSPPDALLGQLPHGKPTEDDARQWLEAELDRVFPKAETLSRGVQLEVRYMDVTFETLNRPEFLKSIKGAYPKINWDRTYEDFRAAGELGKDSPF